jgi:RNA polymerase sigma-70 factor (ECF subfamily)
VPGTDDPALRSPATGNHQELRDLTDRIRRGDVSAETELVHQFTSRVFVMALMRTRDREIARELVQDVLMAVIGALRTGQLHDADKLAAFVWGTARNLINNRLRVESRRPPVEALSDDLVQANAVDQVEEAERLRLVGEALKHLGQKDRTILWMALVEGRKPGEIAVALGLTPEVVRTRKLRAIRKMANLVKGKLSRSSSRLPHD